MAVSERRLIAAVQVLNRIRAADKVEADGSRVLWHQGTHGVELLSFVDPEGRLERQDLTLFGDQIVWERSVGLRSGVVVEGGGSLVSTCSALVRFDDQLSAQKVDRALRGLSSYRGNDRYVLHLRDMLERSGDDLFDSGFLATRNEVIRLPGTGGRRRRVLLVAGAAALAAAAITLITAFR